MQGALSYLRPLSKEECANCERIQNATEPAMDLLSPSSTVPCVEGGRFWSLVCTEGLLERPLVQVGGAGKGSPAAAGHGERTQRGDPF
jgi:hypothetical protein